MIGIETAVKETGSVETIVNRQVLSTAFKEDKESE